MARKQTKKKSKGSAGLNKNLSEEFINKYCAKHEVNRTSSGLIYRVIDEAEGQKPDDFDSVKVHQRILLADGSVIADTYKTGIPDKFSVAEAIPGLKEGLQLMALNARYEFVIPADLAWGKRGNSQRIGPNAVLIMNVRLLEII